VLPFARLAGAAGVLVLVAAASLAIGARALGPAEVWHGLTGAGSAGATVVRDLRLPRTVLGLLVGVALGLAGALMQALTRNPLADPGLLGVNAGASAAVVSAIAFLGVTDLSGYVWFAFAGAALVSVVVYAVAGGRGSSPGTLALSGTAAGGPKGVSAPVAPPAFGGTELAQAPDSKIGKPAVTRSLLDTLYAILRRNVGNVIPKRLHARGVLAIETDARFVYQRRRK